MKLRIFFFILFFPSILVAQKTKWQPVYVTGWGHLYKAPDNKSDILGIFATEASIMVLDSTVYFYKIQVSNGDIGYILKQPLDTRMFARRSPGEPLQYFYRGEEGLQSPHAYVQVSGLRVRKEKNTQSKVIRVLPINAHISLDYVPLYDDGWVYIGDHFHERPAYVQYKFLGKRISFEKALEDYNKASSPDQQKIFAERLMEIGWSDNVTNRLKALHVFKSFQEKTGNLHKFPDLDFEIFMTEQMQNPMGYEEQEKFLKNANFHFIIDGQKVSEGKILESFAKKLNMKRTTAYDSRFDCSWEPEFRYVSPSMEIVYEKDDAGIVNGFVKQMQFTNTQAVMFNNVKIDNNLTERDFVIAFGRVLDVMWYDAPHVYRIQDGDAGFFAISFRNGKAYSYEIFFYC